VLATVCEATNLRVRVMLAYLRPRSFIRFSFFVSPADDPLNERADGNEGLDVKQGVVNHPICVFDRTRWIAPRSLCPVVVKPSRPYKDARRTMNSQNIEKVKHTQAHAHAHAYAQVNEGISQLGLHVACRVCVCVCVVPHRCSASQLQRSASTDPPG
jgi:hypothetical protein